ncbi:hypothetical protein [Rhizobium ruizarguesonis]|uniref:hypothetical protein n=1 Tax=Rhizobium ruizarguesonis TaxID=2081791 RepID=UPI0010308A76|nr:hypothetical protein [Rhizobium ruizarguesonis]TAU25554.1 hypothetical protein ELI48_04765 [Rhizobium ruizarguesonis]TAW01974.1 hypothetical protein ELI25_37770 [Rhizobium ruizarguesonis]TAW08795.1 hypothetical protein ELI26_03890 [Rhizobium ruizarguesonis]TAW97260.1 hypothetical protein ELI12_03975 [Rhizobium ruizarguesonis]TAZ43480.1 hypothetical protein ELH76_37805 [Rhizobium ruizarguesonis]
MSNADFANTAAASERFLRLYERHCVEPDEDTLFSFLEASHSLNDRLKIGADLDFFDVSQFAALKCLRNYFHHHQELKHLVSLVPVGDYPIVTDLMYMCVVPRTSVEAAIEETMPRHKDATRRACQDLFHWYGPVVNINPCIFNFVVLAYERLVKAGIPLAGDSVENFRASYDYEEKMRIPHLIDGRFSTSAGNVDRLLSEIVATTT